MPDNTTARRLARVTRGLPIAARYTATAFLVAASLAIESALERSVSNLPPHLFYLPAVIAAAGLFDRGSGLLAVALSAAALSLTVANDAGGMLGLGLFVALSGFVAVVMERLHGAVESFERAERRRSLLLQEFRHRSRNDLQSLAALLRLRARTAPSAAAGDGLREAAGHAAALARVHAWLAPRASRPDDPATVDTHGFLVGLSEDLRLAQVAAMRPVSVCVAVEGHPIDSERAVQLGLALNELLAGALDYAFPDDQPGRIDIGFRREGDEFVLSVADDGVGEEEGTGVGASLGTRMISGMAAQLRGCFQRGPGPTGVGTQAVLRFPVGAC